MNHDNLSRRGAIMIDRETLHARQMRRAAPKKLRVRHLPARANPRSSPFGLAWRAATEQNRLWKPASGESRFIPGEAGAAFLIGPPNAGKGLLCLGFGFAMEKATIESEEPLRADGM